MAFFIAAECYKTSTMANASHITKIGQLVAGGKDCCEIGVAASVLTLNKERHKLNAANRLQYGQNNADGEL